MCDYSKGVFQKGVEQGIKEGINVLISIMIEDNRDEDTIVNRISEKYKISTEETKEYYNNYKNSRNS